MEVRIYKALLNGKETIDSYTIWLKPTKKAAARGAIINALCCNAIGEQVYGYWDCYSNDTRIGLDVNLGKRMKLDNVPSVIRRHAEYLTKNFHEACVTDNWDEWNSL